jgi:hypothetical protein
MLPHRDANCAQLSPEERFSPNPKIRAYEHLSTRTVQLAPSVRALHFVTETVEARIIGLWYRRHGPATSASRNPAPAWRTSEHEHDHAQCVPECLPILTSAQVTAFAPEVCKPQPQL